MVRCSRDWLWVRQPVAGCLAPLSIAEQRTTRAEKLYSKAGSMQRNHSSSTVSDRLKFHAKRAEKSDCVATGSIVTSCVLVTFAHYHDKDDERCRNDLSLKENEVST